MRIIAFIIFASAAILCFSQPEYTHKQKILLQSDDESLQLHCKKNKFIVSFNPADLSYAFSDEKKRELDQFLNRNDTIELDSLIEKATSIVRDTNMNFCSIRFSTVISKCFLNGSIAVKNTDTNVFLKKIFALVDDRMSWMLVNYYYFTDPKKSSVIFEYSDVSFGCPAF
ncbi:MAG: hypothetical protein A2W93_06500 [Bacteroidetes bacterium GWF2_43_63]|nr:MAG: hypothetical protein A2W94_08035 [Bacteroidetes bacterium GWE2_42_42]OFY53270.1 MAG: hypothetical protein A2W93_06500 [Bacteroidetes bacterium GWF2_43_63]HBG71737.1 hypothetical protein [Bacteroidales bacterium]HCB61598.1 hypothetical protein [Bacteroidales bacterium]HCY22810.1 hypothetical protein [Bacteroidales bacterium]